MTRLRIGYIHNFKRAKLDGKDSTGESISVHQCASVVQTNLRNVLIIDDEQAIHTMYQTALQPDTGDSSDPHDATPSGDVSVRPIVDFTLHHALSGEEGLRICQALDARRTPPQLAFVDMWMKEWDGVETIHQLRAFDPRLSFVVVTGFPDHALEEIGRRVGAVPIQVFAKPVPFEQLYQTTYSLVSRWNRLHGDG